jgi:hypothetical protein
MVVNSWVTEPIKWYCQNFYEKSENKKFSNADAEDVLAPALFRGGVRDTTKEVRLEPATAMKRSVMSYRGRRGSSSQVNLAYQC